MAKRKEIHMLFNQVKLAGGSSTRNGLAMPCYDTWRTHDEQSKNNEIIFSRLTRLDSFR